MKKTITYLLMLVALLTYKSAEAQGLSFSITPNLCFTGAIPATTCNAAVTINTIGATSFSWTCVSVASPFVMGVTSPLGGSSWSNTAISFSACGVYSVLCQAYNGASLLGSTSSTINVICPNWLTFINPGSYSLCPGNSLTMTAGYAGVTGYSWFNGATVISTASTAVITPSANSCYTVTAINPTSGCTGSAAVCVSIMPTPVISVSASPSIVCSGSSLSLTASGALSYTWVPGMFASNQITLYPTASTCYTAFGANMNGCIGSAVSCVSVAPMPTLAVIGNTVACLGAAINLTAAGASNYNWSAGSATSVSSNFNFSPASAGQFTWQVVGASVAGCTTTATGTVTINPTPVITVAGNNTVCAGASSTLTASGGISYTWSTGSTGASIITSPLTSICYTVMGAGINNCSSLAISCVTVQAPTLIAGPVSQTVCSGSSASFSVSGAGTYTWSNNANTSTINVLPVGSSNYTVSGTGANGCIDVTVVTALVDTSCTNVWPGDANSDGIVDNTDVFEIGFAYGNTGAARSPGSNTYISQYANNWAGTVSTGKNKCNADCNGDGAVNNGDTLAIYNNYSLTHAFKPSSTNSATDIYIVPDQLVIGGGTWNKADIMMGDAASQVSQLYGVAYTINFDESAIETNSAYILYTPSFLNAANQNVEFKKPVFNNGKIYTTSVRRDGINASGNGKIGEFWFKVKTGLAENTQLNISVSAAKKTDKAGLISPLTAGSAAVLSISNTVGLKENTSLKNAISFFPNPTAGQLTLQSNASSEVKYSVFDITGREVNNGRFTSSKNLDLSGYANGTYIIRFESAAETLHKKFIIEK